MPKVLQLDSRDNVLIALQDLKKGEIVAHDGVQVTLATDVPAKQKFSTTDLAVGDEVTMYGVLVGKTFRPVLRGELLTTGNLSHESAPYRERSGEYRWRTPDVSRWKDRKFSGYTRSDGQVGTRNYWIVVPLVFCENRNILNLKQAFEEELGFARPQVYRRQVAELAKAYREGRALPSSSGAVVEQQARPSDRLFPHVDGIKFLLHKTPIIFVD